MKNRLIIKIKILNYFYLLLGKLKRLKRTINFRTIYYLFNAKEKFPQQCGILLEQTEYQRAAKWLFNAALAEPLSDIVLDWCKAESFAIKMEYSVIKQMEKELDNEKRNSKI